MAIDPPYVVSFVHVSDIHWDFADPLALHPKPTLGDKRESTAANHGLITKALHKASAAAAALSDKTYLILGGDNVYKSRWDKRRVTTLNDELLLPTVNLTVGGEPVFHGVIAVPGNHDTSPPPRRGLGDVETQPTDSVVQGDKFHEFRLLCAQLQANTSIPITFSTPFQSPLLRIIYGGGASNKPEKSISVWAVNSAEKCRLADAAEEKLKTIVNGIAAIQIKANKKSRAVRNIMQKVATVIAGAKDDAKDKFYDPGYVDRDVAADCENTLAPLTDTLRIAVLHHNNLPTNNDDSKKYRFLNASFFNNFLLHNRFRIILHGHEHVAEVAAYTKFNSSQPSEYASYLTDGFLAIGAPAFNIGPHPADQRGFNIIRIELHDSHDICRVSVTTHVWDSSRMVLESHVRVHDIALRTPTDKKRLRALSDVNRIIFGDSSLRGIARAIDSPDYDQNHAEFLRKEIRECDNIRAIYALSVFTPTYWLHSKLMEVFEPLGRLNIKRAAYAYVRDKSMSAKEEGLLFKFSKPLLFALGTAARNAAGIAGSDLQVLAESMTRRPYAQAVDFLKSRYDAFAGGLESLSFFGQAIMNRSRKLKYEGVPTSGAVCDTWVAEGPIRPFANFGGVHFERELSYVSKLSEFPRIVLWEQADFLNPSALDIIVFHEAMGFPLFWLDPLLLRTQKGAARQPVGYVSIIAPRVDDNDVQTTSELFHHSDGTKLFEVTNFVDRVWGCKDLTLWPLEKAKMGLAAHKFEKLGRNDRALHEYVWLLGHPSLTFAADAWCARQTGDNVWSKFRSDLTRQFKMKGAKPR
jgi:hypothetical protein